MKTHLFRSVRPYLVAITSTGIALLLTLWFAPLLDRTLGAFFYVAIILTTWYGGIRPGLFASILSLFAINYFFIPPAYYFSVATKGDVLRLCVFALVAILINLYNESLRASQRRVALLSQRLQEESNDRLTTALEAAQMGLWDWDLTTGKIRWSPEHEQLLGMPAGSFDGRYETFDARLHPDDRAELNHAVEYSLKQQIPYHHEFRVVWPDGSIHWMEGRGKAFYNADGQPLRMSGTIMAIDQRKQAELELQKLNAELEQRVAERTTELTIVNDRLLEALKALRQSEATFRSMNDFSPMGIFLCEADGNCIYCNRRYQQIIGCTAEESLGDGWQSFIHPDDREWVLKQWAELLASGSEGVFNDLRYQDRQGRVCYTQVRTAPVKASDGTITLFIGIIEDITEQRKVDQMKREFISVVSHELRTPLTSIRGALGLVAGGVYDKKPEKMKEMIAIAARQSDRLVRLVNDILDLRRLEAGQANFDFKPHAAAELIRQAVDGLRSQVEHYDITLKVIPSTAMVWADADAIVQTLTNLISNAIKFSPAHSTITVSAELSSLLPAQSAPITLFSIQDQGRGIPADQLETIFRQFQQVDASDSREKGGTGLGLAICRTIVEQHHGKIWAESKLEQGSTFFFTIPSTSEKCGVADLNSEEL